MPNRDRGSLLGGARLLRGIGGLLSLRLVGLVSACRHCTPCFALSSRGSLGVG